MWAARSLYQNGFAHPLCTFCARTSLSASHSPHLAQSPRLVFGGAQTLWILDEPLNALDVAAVVLVRDRIAEHLDRGGVVVLTSHQDVELGGLRMRRLLLGG